ncbi:hypothetical protein JD844_023447 [Phrynosoma platyrhinos]|uniref:Centromere protein Q n=1 Tax=Phrynosoma platyrhinos TaxID=52577 RepID=A0ABQ7SWP2_PHRPL|nr:hypothetical protein JD844_023447 [Phrynosoma platyrhinos]
MMRTCDLVEALAIVVHCQLQPTSGFSDYPENSPAMSDILQCPAWHVSPATSGSHHNRHINDRLLNSFETLRVPVEKLSSWKNVHKILAKEKKRSVVIEEGLEELQKELDKVLQAAELREKSIECFQNKLQELKSELAAEEAAAIKNELLKFRNEQLLNDLNTIQQSDEMKTVSAFLEQVNENIDF